MNGEKCSVCGKMMGNSLHKENGKPIHLWHNYEDNHNFYKALDEKKRQDAKRDDHDEH